MKPISSSKTAGKRKLSAYALLAALPIGGLLCIAFPSGLKAQEDEANSPDTRCWLASKSYSAGIVISGGGGALVCNDAGAWEPTETLATGCIFGSDFYSAGASMQRLSNAPTNLCTEKGTWGIADLDE